MALSACSWSLQPKSRHSLPSCSASSSTCLDRQARACSPLFPTWGAVVHSRLPTKVNPSDSEASESQRVHLSGDIKGLVVELSIVTAPFPNLLRNQHRFSESTASYWTPLKVWPHAQERVKGVVYRCSLGDTPKTYCFLPKNVVSFLCVPECAACARGCCMLNTNMSQVISSEWFGRVLVSQWQSVLLLWNWCWGRSVYTEQCMRSAVAAHPAGS